MTTIQHTGSRRIPPENRFWDKVNIGKPDECWEWTASRYPNGYGAFATRHGKVNGAHRFAYILSHGPIPDGMIVCHRCDNPPCCNPSHLFLGTVAINSRDMVLKGRSTRGRPKDTKNLKRGDQHYASKLSEAQVIEIRKTYIRGKFGYHRLAKRFGVAIESIVQIIKRESWKHVP